MSIFKKNIEWTEEQKKGYIITFGFYALGLVMGVIIGGF